MVVVMAEFPPNLEDGEHWLPSDVFMEIGSAKLSPKFQSHQPFIDNIAQHRAIQVSINPNKSTAKSSSNVEIRNDLVGTKPIGNGAGGSRVCNVDRSPYASRNGGFQPVFGSISVFNPITPAQTQVESSEKRGARVLQGQKNSLQPVQVNGEEVNGFVGKCGGTGVFLPRIRISRQEPKEVEWTGVFLHRSNVPTTSHKKKKSGKNGKAMEKVCALKKEAPGEQKESQLPPGDICLKIGHIELSI